MVGEQRCFDDKELEQSVKLLTSLQVGSVSTAAVMAGWFY